MRLYTQIKQVEVNVGLSLNLWAPMGSHCKASLFSGPSKLTWRG